MKTYLTALLVIAALMCLPGCGRNTSNSYVSARNEYSLHYPAGWNVIDDAKKLADTIKKAGIAGSPAGSSPAKPEVVFISKQGIGIVARVPMPKETSKTTAMSSLEVMARCSSGSEAKVDRRDIHGTNFLVVRNAPEGAMVSTSSFCVHDGYVYTFQFASPKEQAEKTAAEFVDCLNSVSFQKTDIAKAQADVKKQSESKKAGFFTGLWQGYLVIFRWLALSFWSFDLYAQSNTGLGYAAGFIIGVLAFVGHAAESKR